MKLVYTYALGDAGFDCIEMTPENLASMKLQAGTCISAAELSAATRHLQDALLQDLIVTLCSYSKGNICIVSQSTPCPGIEAIAAPPSSLAEKTLLCPHLHGALS